MNDIRQLVSIAARRLETSALFEKSHLTAIVIAVIALLLMVADRLTASAFVPWMWVAPALIALGSTFACAWWVRRRQPELHVAVLVDERLDLREKLSTAMHVADRDDPFARAAVEDAVLAARDPRNRELVKRRFAVQPPRGWYASPLIIVVAMLLSMIEPLDLFAREPEIAPDVQAARTEVAEALDSVVQTIQQQPELSSALSDVLGDLSDAGTDPDALKSPEQVRRNAIKRITDLNNRLEEIISGEQGKTAEAIDRAMKQLKAPDSGPGKELAEAMASADFTGAKEALEKLLAEIEAGELSPEQQAQLQQQLQDLADQLEKLSQQQQQLENALRQAGMDPQLAQNADALQQAIQNNQNLNEQQKQQLQQMAQAQQAASQACQALGGACASLAQAMSQDGQPGQAAGQLSDSLSDLEQMQMLLQQAQAAANACQGSCQGLGQGLGLSQAMDMWAQGGQGMGQGQGGGPRPTAPSPTRTRIEHVPGETGPGDIIARMLIDGPQTVGESKVVPSEVVASVVEGLEKGLAEDQLPRKYHEAQKHFFGELEKKTKAVERGEPQPASNENSD